MQPIDFGRILFSILSPQTRVIGGAGGVGAFVWVEVWAKHLESCEAQIVPCGGGSGWGDRGGIVQVAGEEYERAGAFPFEEWLS